MKQTYVIYSVTLFVLLFFITLGATAPSSLDNKVTGGSDAKQNQFPYQVSLQWGQWGSYGHICGGSIITSYVILTAGHCITETPPGFFRVKAGLLNLDDSHSLVQISNVATILLHPNYQGGVNPNDIALLRLQTPLIFTVAVQPISLPPLGVIPTGNAVLSGWGSTSLTTTPSMPNTLQTAILPLISYAACVNALIAHSGTSEPLAPTNVCAGPLTGGVSSCSGDSGGPLVQNGQIIGIVSWGMVPCGSPGSPSVYTQVSSFIGWIVQNL